MNPFRQNIGIYYKDKWWAKKIREQLVKEAAEDIVRCSLYFIEFKDGSIVHFRVANDSARGYRHTKAYLQEGIDKDIYEQVIAPSMLPCGQVFVIADYDGLTPWGQHYIADRYYRSKEKPISNEEIFKREYECIWGEPIENDDIKQENND